MEAVYASIVAVLGTLFGAGVTHWFQRQAADRAEQVSRNERVRQDRLAAYGEFAEAVTDYRGSHDERWRCGQIDPASEESRAAEAESYRLRKVTRQIRWRIQLLTDDEELMKLADEAVQSARRVREASDHAEWKQKHDAAGKAIEQFVSHAATHVR